MKATQSAEIVLINAIESVDEKGELLPFEQRRKANDVLEGEDAGSPLEALSTRAKLLLVDVSKRAPWLPEMSQRFASISWGFTLVVVLLAAIFGAGVQVLGSGKTFHVLSAPLLGLLVWNFFSLSLLLLGPLLLRRLQGSAAPLSEFAGGLGHRAAEAMLWIRRKLYRWWLPSTEERTQQVAAQALQRFWQTWPKHASPLYQAQVGRTLHLGAIAFCLSALFVAYGGGLTKAYLATQESTFLNATQIRSVLHLLFFPSQLVLGALPKATADAKGLLGPAAPWIHHYTVTLILFVVLPRLALVAWTWLQSAWLQARLPLSVSAISQSPTLNVALASHTNVGKTSLARTLLRRDVGEVRDAEHVTRYRAGYYMLRTDEARLRLWDTPGFGDAKALYESLSKPQRSWTWLRSLQEPKLQYDREAALSLQDEADLILYLVPAHATEAVEQTIRDEWDVLRLLERPVICLLNRLEGVDLKEEKKLIQRWKDFFAKQPLCRGVLSLDAFSRSWEDERALLKAIEEAVDEPKRPVARRLLEAWEAQREQEHKAISAALSSTLSLLSHDSEANKQGQKLLTERASRHIQKGQKQLLEQIGLEGELQGKILADTEALLKQLLPNRGERTMGAVLGSVLTGLTTGLITDILAGGFTFGGGMVLGAIAGALGGAALGEGYRQIGKRTIVWDEKFLQATTFQMTLLYLTAMSFGRARGAFTEDVLPSEEKTNEQNTHHQLFTQAAKFALEKHWPYLWPLLAVAHEDKEKTTTLWQDAMHKHKLLPAWVTSLDESPQTPAFDKASVREKLEQACAELLHDAQQFVNEARLQPNLPVVIEKSA